MVIKFDKNGSVIVPKIRHTETKSQKRIRLRLAYQKKYYSLVEKHKFAADNGMPWVDEDLKEVLRRLEQKRDLEVWDYLASAYKRTIGAIDWIWGNRNSLLKGYEKSSNKLDEDGFARQIKRCMQELNLIK